MQAETKKAEGVQHQQASQIHDTPLPHDTADDTALVRTEIPPGLEKLHAAIHGDLGKGSMTWTKQD